MSKKLTTKETNLINEALKKKWVEATHSPSGPTSKSSKPDIPPNRIEELMSMLQFLAYEDYIPQQASSPYAREKDIYSDRTQIQPRTREYEYLMEEWANQGMPYVRQFTKEKPNINTRHGDDKRAYFTWAGKGGGPSRFPEQPDTVHVNPGDVSDLLAEFGHTDQWNASQDIRDKMAEWSSTDRAALPGMSYDAFAYDTKGRLEYDAHSLREPEFNRRYYEALKETEETRKKRENTGLLSYIKNLFTY